ncbi:alginate export family protein [Catenovulum sp. 2E275]|uniref:alginate export family protein n=1 Tax=Catenovulum sp. 2E275 TaxID=2980497 RepID=UPI0021CF4C97|nr:alginate export family protein [Catenovulum sp. 2E275]MCU4677678.1 alginate export family protein [Catenovulum sp. 2E275]
MIVSPLKYSKLLALPIICVSTFAQAQTSWQTDGSYRLRYETLNNAYRANANGSDQILASQLLFSIKAKHENLLAQLEIQDSRTWLDDAGTPLGTDDVNALEPLQLWLGWQISPDSLVKVGRQTLDIGSRRLMARQRFRNTISAYDGAYARFQQNDWLLQSFYFMPVERHPESRADLDDNKIKLDKQGDDKFWGVHLSQNSANTNPVEFYYYGLDKSESDLSISTLGIRYIQPNAVNHWDYEIEAAYQFGDNQSLDVKAGLLHAHLGYSLADSLSSRLEFMFDYASGDDDPNDGKDNRFNTLSGVSRFDFGPTGIYGAFSRANIVSPGVKWGFKPDSTQTVFVAYRAVWLDSETDSQARSGLRDTTGQSGTFAGHQLESRWRYKLNKAVQLELGGTYLVKGEFLQDAPNSPQDKDTAYFYSQFSYQF